MVIVNVSDGSTVRFDLSEPSQHQALTALIISGRVSALSILHNGTQHSLPLPKRFKRPLYGAEPVSNGTPRVIGERIYIQAGDVRVSLTATFTGSVVRCDLVRTGRQRYSPPSKDLPR